MPEHQKNKVRMKIAIVQMSPDANDFGKNLSKANELAKKAKELGAEMAVFPEMFICGFNYKKNLEWLKANSDLAEVQLCKIAKQNSIAICGSIPHLIDETRPPVNRFLFIDSSGKILAHYDKAHLFSVFNENKYVSRGNEIVVADTPFGKLGFAICYDLRFPDMFTNMMKRGANLIVLSAAFPHPRSEHWRVLCRARAIENQCFLVAVNRSGVEKFPSGEIKYFGMSAVLDPWGVVAAECAPDEEDAIAIADIALSDVDDIRARIPAITDRREDLYKKEV